jgi:sulfur carrier protein
VEIKVNGKTKTVEPGVTVSTLLEELRVDRKTVVVEINLEIPDQKEVGDRSLAEGDNVEIIRLVDGG